MYCVCSSLLHAVCDITLGCCGYLQGNRGTEQVLGRQCEFVGFQGERLQDCQVIVWISPSTAGEASVYVPTCPFHSFLHSHIHCTPFVAHLSLIHTSSPYHTALTGHFIPPSLPLYSPPLPFTPLPLPFPSLPSPPLPSPPVHSPSLE